MKKRLFFINRNAELVYFTDYEFVFSFKKRVATATKSCSVRRSNDNSVTDILFESTMEVNINSAVSAGGTLASWIGSNDGFMVTDYDQTGNGFDMTQSTASKQAKIISAGVWNGYKKYDGIDDVYLSSIPSLENQGSVYVKADKIDNIPLYHISQAKSGDNRILSLSIQFDSPNNKLRILDFTPTFNQIVGNNFMNVGVNKIMYQSNGSSYKMRLNGVNQINTIASGTQTGNWFNDYSFSGFTLQKGGLLWTENLFRSYKEYEILGFKVTHTDGQSLEIENTM